MIWEMTWEEVEGSSLMGRRWCVGRSLDKIKMDRFLQAAEVRKDSVVVNCGMPVVEVHNLSQTGIMV